MTDPRENITCSGEYPTIADRLDTATAAQLREMAGWASVGEPTQDA